MVSKLWIKNKYVIRNEDHHRKSGSSNLLIAIIYSVVELNEIMKLVKAVKFLSPYRRNWIIWELVFSKMLGFTFVILL